MANKGKKKRNSKDSSGNGSTSEIVETTSKKKGGKKKSANKGKSFQCDIFNDAAMDNAYYVCHNVQDVLKSRGFAWPESQKKKKKGKR